MKSGFEVWKAAKESGNPVSKEDIYAQGLLNEGEYAPLDSLRVGRFRGSFGKCYQYKVYDPTGFPIARVNSLTSSLVVWMWDQVTLGTKQALS